jgi:hypothetical protein
MLAKFYRLRFLWIADQTLTFADGARVNVRMSPWKLLAGVLTFDTTITDDMGFTSGTIVTAGESEGGVNTNTSDLNWGIKGFFEVTADLSSTDGSGYLYLEESDDNINWPSDAADFDILTDMRLVGVVTLSTDAVDEDHSVNFEF